MTGQKSSDSKVHSYGKCYHQRYEIHIPFASLKQRYKDGTEKIVHASYAASLFRTLAFYDTYFLDIDLMLYKI